MGKKDAGVRRCETCDDDTAKESRKLKAESGVPLALPVLPAPPLSALRSPFPPCLHRTEKPTHKLGKLPVYGCNQHGYCSPSTINALNKNVKTCTDCSDFTKPPRKAPPVQNHLAVVTCYFNPCGFKTRRENFDRFYAAAQSQGADIYVIEAAECATGSASDPLYELPDDLPNLHRVQFASRLWQKERLLNILIERLPGKYNQVAWVDCDVLFDNPDWVQQTSELLERHHVLQLFEQASFLNQAGVPSKWWSDREGVTRSSVAAKQGKERSLGVVHPGLAWAGRREWIREIGLWDQHIVGSGDSVMVHGFYGWQNKWHMSLTSQAVIEAAATWSRAAYQLIGGNVGCVPGLIRHLWHGDRKHRKYDDRLFYTRLANFDPAKHLERNSIGCWEWSKKAPPEMVEQIETYFRERREDG